MMPYTDYTVRLGDLKKAIMENPYDPNLNIDGYMRYLKYNTPSAQPERLTDDDVETIRIHLNAFKEDLCNQHRWKEAEEYERLINRFMTFASAQPELHYCRECKWSRCYVNVDKHGKSETYWRCLNWDGGTDEEGYCHEWERREE